MAKWQKGMHLVRVAFLIISSIANFLTRHAKVLNLAEAKTHTARYDYSACSLPLSATQS